MLRLELASSLSNMPVGLSRMFYLAIVGSFLLLKSTPFWAGVLLCLCSQVE